MPPDAECFKPIAAGLLCDGYALLPNFIDATLVAALALECSTHNTAFLLLPAAVGLGRTRQLNGSVRGDRTGWFDPLALSLPQDLFWQRMQALRHGLNRCLLLGLEEFETHYALYPPGSRYARHLDRFRDDDLRVLSMVCYLNDDWRESQGGALRLYLHDLPRAADGSETFRDFFPHAGTLIVFLSAEFEHEVLPATRDRLSMAGWFRRGR